MKRLKMLVSMMLLAGITFGYGCSVQCIVCPEITAGVEYTIILPDGTTIKRVTDVNGCIPFTVPGGSNCSDYILEDRGPGPILE